MDRLPSYGQIILPTQLRVRPSANPVVVGERSGRTTLNFANCLPHTPVL